MASSSALQASTFTVIDNYIGQDNGSFENTDDFTQQKFDISSLTYENNGIEDSTSITILLSDGFQAVGLIGIAKRRK